jgi:hypothetical protein
LCNLLIGLDSSLRSNDILANFMITTQPLEGEEVWDSLDVSRINLYLHLSAGVS